ncbi:HK97 gp10 family phage protein [Selenomonas sp. AB3002]|uniref:HK97 gp10 family phage protein n=1 Tax=Selenomonas sp. AB3002 TaxID=1392502 RepID=UPI00068DFBFE
MARRKRNNYKAKSFSRGGITTGQTEKHLKDLGEHVLKAAKDALAECAEKVVNDAKKNCPVYEGHKKENGKNYFAKGVQPGALRDSIKAEPNDKKTVYQISANAKSEDGFLYGQIVEFSPRVNHPFLYPALEENKAYVQKYISEAIQAAIKRGG